MAPYASLVFPCFELLPKAPVVVRMLLPLECLELYERRGAQWVWMPSELDAVDLSGQEPRAFLATLGLKNARPMVWRDRRAPQPTSVMNFKALIT